MLKMQGAKTKLKIKDALWPQIVCKHGRGYWLRAIFGPIKSQVKI
jgi:hypothetical protein